MDRSLGNSSSLPHSNPFDQYAFFRSMMLLELHRNLLIDQIMIFRGDYEDGSWFNIDRGGHRRHVLRDGTRSCGCLDAPRVVQYFCFSKPLKLYLSHKNTSRNLVSGGSEQ